MTPLEQQQAREAANDARRARMRDRWAKDADAWREKNAPAPVEVIPKVVIPFGKNIEVAIRNRVRIKFGPLIMFMERFEQDRIMAAVMRMQSEARAWPDGTMRGIKRLIWRAGVWVSPSQGTVWKNGTCSADDFDETGELRGHAGIHAVWPDKLKELNYYDGRLVEIAGWGQCTVGDLGWRAQHARVVREIL